ncbi:MAG: hypothetical protein CBC10_011620 [Gammaproteobacteria bacterium TMED50]|nr:MAG: hypothetical protein CBC10_011620 [Gammaproteobacteria bacterium TMED50]
MEFCTTPAMQPRVVDRHTNEEYGGVEAYVISIGLSETEIQRLRSKFVESA